MSNGHVLLTWTADNKKDPVYTNIYNWMCKLRLHDTLTAEERSIANDLEKFGVSLDRVCFEKQ